jgi:hypothetical protein
MSRLLLIIRWLMPAVAAASLTGCVAVTDTSTVSKNAAMVTLMVSGGMGEGPFTEADLIGTVAEYGGQYGGQAYVTAISRSGRIRTGTMQTIVHAVLIGSQDQNSAPVMCYRVTVGYVDWQVSQAREACPGVPANTPGGYATIALAQAGKIALEEDSAMELPVAAQVRVAVAPMSRLQAIRLLGLGWRARRKAGVLPVTASEFAADGARSALALRLRAGGCVYLSMPDNPDGNGLPGPWLSPVHAACTGAAALAASGWISQNPTAGG